MAESNRPPGGIQRSVAEGAEGLLSDTEKKNLLMKNDAREQIMRPDIVRPQANHLAVVTDPGWLPPWLIATCD